MAVAPGSDTPPNQGIVNNALKEDFPDDEVMRVSHESLYQALFVQAKGQLKTQLVGRLRTGKVRRVSRAERRMIV